MWVMQKNGLMVGDWKNCENDILDIELSLFRGPNRVVWYHFYPMAEVTLKSSDTDSFRLVMTDGKGGIEFTIYLKLETILWDNEKNCLLIRLIPDMYYHAQNNMVNMIKNAKNIKDILIAMFPKAASIKVAGDLQDMHLYSGGYCRSTILEFIAKYCEDNNREFYLSDTDVALGIIQDDASPELISSITMKENTMAEFNRYGVIFSMYTLDKAVQYPSKIIKVDGNVSRIIYTRIYAKSDYLTSTVLCSEMYKKVTEYMLATLLNTISRDSLLQDILRNNSVRNIVVGKTSTDTEFEKQVKFENYMRDMQNLNVLEGTPFRVVKSSPYAGDSVGLQFPTNASSHIVAVANEGEYSSLMEVAQLFQKTDGEMKAPVRSSLNDFRLTLPDGGSFYYDNANESWILAAKAKITLGVQADVSATAVPSPTKYIELNIAGVGSIKLATENHTHTFDHKNQVIAPGMITAPASTTVESTTLAKTSKPDKNSTNFGVSDES